MKKKEMKRFGINEDKQMNEWIRTFFIKNDVERIKLMTVGNE